MNERWPIGKSEQENTVNRSIMLWWSKER